ncbi:MAG: DUF63 family protein [Candidatus Anstonellales archaeon]
MGFVEDYFISPIVERSGYNIVNTTVYALIAIAILWVVEREFRKRKIAIDRRFIANTLLFVLAGSSARAVTDATDSGLIGEPFSSIYKYSLLTVTPGIYIVTAALFFASLFVFRKIGRDDFGIVAVPFIILHLFLIAPFFVNHLYIMITIMLALLPSAYFLTKFKDNGIAVAGQALDGAATFVAIEISGMYGEQHVITAALGEWLGYFAFYLVKIALAALIVHFTKGEKEGPFICLVVAVAGFAPGIRDSLRLWGGF